MEQKCIYNIICFTNRGKILAEELRRADFQNDYRCYYKSESIVANDFCQVTESVSEFGRKCFKEGLPLIVVGAVGIAVRMIADSVRDKLTDIPVIVIDELGLNVIPILSGHVGGANEIARRIEILIGARAVITTATDINDTFSVDEFASRNRLTINNREGIRKVSGKVLRGSPISISVKNYPPEKLVDIVIADYAGGGNGELYLTTKPYVLGIGCKKNKPYEDIQGAVDAVLAENKICWDDIFAFGSIDIKEKEEGLQMLSNVNRVPFVTFDVELLGKAKGEFNDSEFVCQTVGIGNVCERAAMLLAGEGGELLSGKKVFDGVTVALARRNI